MTLLREVVAYAARHKEDWTGDTHDLCDSGKDMLSFAYLSEDILRCEELFPWEIFDVGQTEELLSLLYSPVYDNDSGFIASYKENIYEYIEENLRSKVQEVFDDACCLLDCE
jgi:hypothetical protein